MAFRNLSCVGVLGAYAASAANGSKRIAWRRCTFTDISAGAVMLGDFKSWNCNGECLCFCACARSALQTHQSKLCDMSVVE